MPEINYCGECGAKVDNKEARICTKCGADPRKAVNHCISCGAKLKSKNAQVCVSCGSGLGKSPEKDPAIAALIAAVCMLILGAPGLGYF